MIAKKISAHMVFFLSYAAILLITISSLIVYYAQITQQVSVETQQQKLTLLEQLEDNLNDKIRYADALMNSAVSGNKLSQMAKGYDSYTYSDLMTDMQSAYKPDYLLNFSVYIAGTDEVVTEGTHMKAPDFFTYMYHVVGISYESFAREYLNGYKLRTLMPTISVQTFGKNRTTVLPYVQSYPLNPNKKELGQILVLIDTKDISDLIQQLSASTHSNVYILNQNGRLMLSSDKAPALTAGLVGKLCHQGDAFETKMNDDPLMITQISSVKNGWKYVMATPKNVYLRQNAKFALNCLIIFLVYLAAGLLVVNYLARRSYRPIKEIKDIIMNYHTGSVDADKENEFRTIKNTLISQFHIDKQLNETIQSQMPVVRQAYLVSLIKGLEINYDEAQSKLPSLGVRLVSRGFLLATLEFDLDSPFFLESDRFAEEKFSLARVVVQNVSGELTEENQLCFLLDLDRNQSVYFLNIKDRMSAQEAAKQFKCRMEKFTDFVSTNFKLNINIGVSRVHDGLKNLPKCFDEAKKALEISKKGQTYEPVYFGDVSDKNPDYYFPTDTEYLLVSHLKNGNYHEGQELLINIFVINNNLHINAQALNALLNDVSSTLVRVMNGVLAAKKKPSVTAESLLEQLGPVRTLDAAKSLFMDYINRIADASENRTIRKTELLVNNIVEFIDKNVEGNLLDLNYISRKFDVTPQYISNIFKKYRHENIKEYISKLKLIRAKKLLMTTDLSLHDISTRIGYADELGVFRLFRKYENMTPGEYRAIHKKPS